jgi:hypothetical protein
LEFCCFQEECQVYTVKNLKNNGRMPGLCQVK